MPQSRHVINLRGPWQWMAGSSAAQDESSGYQRFTFPDELPALIEPAPSNPILLARDFGRPSGLTDEHRVELVINQPDGCQSIVLNGETLDAVPEEAGTGRYDITSRIQWRNRLRIAYVLPEAKSIKAIPLCDVRIEILPLR